MNLPYTICFIKRDDAILLLHRNKAPNKGKWNGVGGKIEDNELPYISIKREIKEETGLTINSLAFRGIVTWNSVNGMYVYVGSDFDDTLQEGPEGKLEWKSLNWINQSVEVVSNIPFFLPEVLSKNTPKEHAFTYSATGNIRDYKMKQLSSSCSAYAERKSDKEIFS